MKNIRKSLRGSGKLTTIDGKKYEIMEHKVPKDPVPAEEPQGVIPWLRQRIDQFSEVDCAAVAIYLQWMHEVCSETSARVAAGVRADPSGMAARIAEYWRNGASVTKWGLGMLRGRARRGKVQTDTRCSNVVGTVSEPGEGDNNVADRKKVRSRKRDRVSRKKIC